LAGRISRDENMLFSKQSLHDILLVNSELGKSVYRDYIRQIKLSIATSLF